MVRRAELEKFEISEDFKVLKSPVDIPDDVAERFTDLIDGLMIIDFVPCDGSDQSLSVYILYENGTIYNVSVNFELGEDSIEGQFQFTDRRPHKVYRLAKINDSKDFLLVSDIEGRIQLGIEINCVCYILY